MIDWEKRKEEIRELFLNGFLPGRKYSPIIEKQLDKIIEQEKEMIQEFALKFLEFNPCHKNRSDAYKINKLLSEYKIEEI